MVWTKKDALELQALTRQIIATQGEDALRSMAYAVEQKHWMSEQLHGRRLLVAARNDAQLRLFCRSCKIDLSQVRRVLSERDVRGRLTDLPLIVLPGSMRFPDVCEAVTGWLERKGKAIDITEAQVLGEAKFELWALFAEGKS
ncbi:MAG: hypothetical protein K0R17_2748 [Rariglobus sp.]|jgi:hypothetical protein|nr:hypothetical protein [Rariglobus sp.]